jgi:RNA polymerase sigma-70 factor (ECF subfamily)
MNNNEVLERIKTGDKRALEEVYIKYRPEFIGWMTSTYKVSESDAKDLYQQSVLILYENIVNGKLIEMSSNFKTYLYAVGKNKFSELKRQWERNTAEVNDNLPDHFGNNDEDDKNSILLLISEKALLLLGNPCKELLELYYYHKKSMNEIADMLGYKNEGSAKNQKYKCLLRLKDIFQEEMKRNKIVLYE